MVRRRLVSADVLTRARTPPQALLHVSQHARGTDGQPNPHGVQQSPSSKRRSVCPFHVPTLRSRGNHRLRAYETTSKHITVLYNMTPTDWLHVVHLNRSYARCHSSRPASDVESDRLFWTPPARCSCTVAALSRAAGL